jgi:PAS domain S-box-containing protein/putative nucleotidyltransferase with HDIG domain
MDVKNRTTNLAAKPMRLLVVEDSPQDAEIAVREIRRGGFDVTWKRLETAETMRAALREQTWDIILCDYQMPQFSGLAAIALLKETGTDIPMIIVSGAIGEETAVECMRSGANDYVMKGNLSRLVPAIERELMEAESRRERKRAEKSLQESELRYRTLFAQASIGTSILSSDGELVEINEAFARMHGYSVPEMLLMSLKDLDTPATFQHAPERIRRLFAGEVLNFDAEHYHKDGHLIPLEVSVSLISVGGESFMLSLHLDVTERKRAELLARERMKELQALYGLAEMAQREGITLEELYKEFTNILPKSWRYEEIACARLVIGDSEFRTENFAESPWMQSAPIKVNREVVGRIEVGYLEARPEEQEGPFLTEEKQLIDAVAEQLGRVTERKKAADKLSESEQKFRTYIEQAPLAVFVSDLEGRFLDCNPKTADMLGYEANALKKMSLTNIYAEEDRVAIQQALETLRQSGYVEGEFRIMRSDGTSVWILLNISLIQGTLALGYCTDITQRKMSEEAIANLSRHNELILSSTAEGILGVDLQGNHTFVNKAAAKILGYEAEELLGRPSHSIWHHTKPDGSPYPREECPILGTIREGNVHRNSTEVFWRKDGTCFPVGYTSTPIYDKGQVAGVVVTFMDITERKNSEYRLMKEVQRTKLLLELYLMAPQMADKELYDYVLEKTVNLTDSKIGFFHQVADGGKTIILTTWNAEALKSCTAAYDTHYPLEQAGNWVDCVRYKKPIIYNDFPNAPNQKGLPEGHAPIRRFMSIPVMDQDVRLIFGVGNKEEEYDDHDVAHLQLVAIELYKIIIARKAENDLKQSYSLLQESLAGAVQAMATVVESRDPYTAGHQRRVAELAHAIASEMRLPANQVDGIRMAAVIHDLGKIVVPAEILSKPTKLKNSELEIIKDHPQAGYEILKDIAFPWPIARIILEHHEKMDGSGYPNGSVGENTLLESKIITVADIVEAMASHRPYRPALGIDAALAEIEKNKGTLYDTDAVDKCLRLFREKGFKLEGA